MSVIGTFKATRDDKFVGTIATLTLDVTARIVPVIARRSANSPSHRIYAGQAEIGAAWTYETEDGREYLSLKLDDPSFVTTIFANLVQDDEGDNFNLIWSRPAVRTQ